MLTTCPECELQVSDKAIYCPHCGYPLQEKAIKNATKKYKRRKRLPNGFGQISEIKGQNLRKPFRAMITVGKTEEGKPICKPLKPEAYFNTYNEAYTALVDYHRNPYDLDASVLTMSDLYDKWMETYDTTKKSETRVKTMEHCWRYCSEIYDMPVRDIRARHIKGCIEEGFYVKNGQKHYPTANIKWNIKTLFNLMLDFAVEYEVVDKNVARTFSISNETLEEIKSDRKTHIPFTENEFKKLWDSLETEKYVDVILIQCYTGFRPQEISELRVDNVNFEEGVIVGGMKTKAGTDRIVPIHSRIEPLIRKRYEEAKALGSDYLINCLEGQKKNYYLSYSRYKDRFNKIITDLGLNPEHRLHDPRCHFVTMAKHFYVDEYAIKYIIGHVITDLTEKVYTTRDTEFLKKEIEKIM